MFKLHLEHIFLEFFEQTAQRFCLLADMSQCSLESNLTDESMRLLRTLEDLGVLFELPAKQDCTPYF